MEPPTPTAVILVSSPTLTADPQNPNGAWLATVSQQVQFHAMAADTGQQVDDKVIWEVGPWGTGNNPIGTIDQTGKYAAPSSPRTIILVAGIVPNSTHPYTGYKYIDILAAPHITSFIAATLTITTGQSTTLTPSYESGQGQLLVGTQVIQANLVSGTPVTVSPMATTTYTLQVTNAAGAIVSQDLTVTVS